MTMMGRFTERAQKAISLAQESAKELKHNYVGTEHLLLGLLREGEGVAAKALQMQGIEVKKVLAKIKEFIGEGEELAEPQGFTPRTKRILELSFREALKMGTGYIGTEHLLLALIKEDDCVAARILSNMSIEPQKLYDEIVGMLGGNVGGGEQSGIIPPMGKKQTQKGGKSNTPTLDQFGRDFTHMANEGKFDPVVGREKEIERVIQILSRRTKNNPCLIGEPGVGKTAIIEGLAQKITEGNVPEILKDKRIVTLDLSAMVAGSKYRGEFEERIKKAMEEIINAGDVVLFIDEIHTIIGAGAAEGAIDASNILKPSLARGEIQLIGATTLEEYRKYIEKDAALERRFQPVQVGEPSEEEAIQILKGLRDKYEAHHKVKITDEALEAAVKLSNRYIADRFLPDKAIDLVDEAASRVRLRTFTAPPEVKELEEKLENLQKEKEAAIKAEEYERAGKIRNEENETKEELEKTKNEWYNKNNSATQIVDEEAIAEIVGSWTGIPVRKLQEEESERLLKMEEILHKRVIGQDQAATAVAKAIRRGRVGLKDPNRPTGSFIFLGPTGVGKTELTKALAEALFGDENAMIRIDMSEYMEKHSVSKLVGAPPGYVGYEEGGYLTEKVRRRPYSVILLDEIEKAHPDIFNMLLQILDDGRLTDSQGRTVNFKNTVIIMTSNVGARNIIEPKKLGFTAGESKEAAYEDMKKNVMEELKRTFRPEFLNRVDDTIVFHALSEDDIKNIVGVMLEDFAKRLKANAQITIEIKEEAKELLAKVGFDKAFGARPLRRAIQNHIEDQLAEKMLEAAVKPGDHVVITAKDEKIVFEK